MTDNDNIEYLKLCLEHTTKQHGEYPKDSPFIKRLWWGNQETVEKVRHILVESGYLSTLKSVIDFSEQPYKWEREMQEIIDCSKQEANLEA